MGFPDISGSSVDWKLFLVVLELFRWIYFGIIIGWNNCRFPVAHFPVLDLSRNRGSAAQIFTKTIFN
ncbi:putative peroxidase 18 [Iris pallida]|uniref:Peroxidase 18 n=1 Tax=Iris pallida TaxID=29817 RepID=A0AAX6E5K9_IRIPA|nr:putative peroxidase 18 [Iris pallida]